MPATYVNIASTTLGSATNTVTFSSIPQTYTDLVLRISARWSNYPTDYVSPIIRVNGLSTTIYSFTAVYAYPSASSERVSNNANFQISRFPGTTPTANVFSNNEIYFPNYTSSNNKPVSATAVGENNSSTVYALWNTAGLIRTTAAINQISFSDPTYSFATGSSFYLYGIKNS